jgi:hypothetical protein
MIKRITDRREAQDRQDDEAYECEPPSGACKSRRQQQEADDPDQNNEIGRDRKETEHL